MDLHQVDLEEKKTELPLEEAADSGAEAPAWQKRPRKKTGLLWLAALAAAVGVILLIALPDRGLTAAKIEEDPLGTLQAAADRVAPLPQPLSVGFLGTLELEGTVKNCAGDMTLDPGEGGLALQINDCTLGSEEETLTFSLYADPGQLAALAPDVLGVEGWRGVSLAVPLTGQIGEDVVVDEAGLAETQARLDAVRDALSAVTGLGLTGEERTALEAYLAGARPAVEETEVGYLLTFAQSDGALSRDLALAFGLGPDAFPVPSALDFDLTRDGVLRGVTGAGGALAFSLELGDDPAHELNPRLEANWAGGAVTLAFTLGSGQTPEAPAWTPAFEMPAQE